MDIRHADESELDHLARLWYTGWQDAHALILPVELKRDRTFESFRERLSSALERVRVSGPPGAPVGFCIIKGDELYQLYLSSEARGSGLAAKLVADAEIRLAENGVETAWLSCAIGNDRAARFYEKCGWRRTGRMRSRLQTANGLFELETWRFEKELDQQSKSPDAPK